jgi:flagellar basal body-associated protein FliL
MAYQVNSKTFKNNNSKKKKNQLIPLIIIVILALLLVLVNYVMMDINNAIYEQSQETTIQAEETKSE